MLEVLFSFLKLRRFREVTSQMLPDKMDRVDELSSHLKKRKPLIVKDLTGVLLDTSGPSQTLAKNRPKKNRPEEKTIKLHQEQK